MAELAKSAVLVSSTAEMPVDVKESVSGPSWEDLHSVEAVLRKCGTVGFQASNLASAISICKMMLKPQTPSPSLLPTADGNGKADREGTTASLMVQPTIFVGVTANLLGTGCRDAIRFLCKECVPLPEGVEPAALPDDGQCAASTGSEGAIRPSPCASQALIHVLVVSGGAMEHDIRSVCEPYRLSKSGGEATHESRFGNVSYSNAGAGTDSVFSEVMRRLVERLAKAQREERARCEASPIPDAYYDVCSWAIAPSTLWHMAGIWLPDLLAEALQEVGGFEEESAASGEASRRAQNTVLYWAARNGVPIFSPSLTDGDIMQFILPEGTENTPSLQLDLVSDIHRLNKLAMLSRRTGMIILGGGVVKHHVCNANLMRNGADYAVYLNDGQEFDGSDAGARPDEAVSWGKLRLNSSYVKVYSEVSLVLPLLVAHVFVDWVRTARV